MAKRKKVIVHITSTMGLGGVQSGIVKSMVQINETMDYHVFSLGEISEKMIAHLPDNIKSKIHFVGSRFYYLGWISSVSKIFALNPDVVVVSLWKSTPPAIIFKLLNPKVPIIAFYHSVKAVHFADKMCQWLLGRFQNKTFTDSRATAESVSKRFGIKNPIPIPYHFDTTFGQKEILNKSFNEPFKLVYFGRLSKEKGIPRALKFCSFLKSLGVKFEYHLYASGNVGNIQEQIVNLHIDDCIILKDTVSPIQVSALMRQYDFLLQLSDFEGLALAVVEAMNCGLVPIVTKVGEIASYCKHLENAFVLSDSFDDNLNAFAVEFFQILKNQEYLGSMRFKALSTFKGELSYRDVFCREIESLLAK